MTYLVTANPCPYCREPAWSWCRDFRGFPAVRCHKRRRDLAATQSATAPTKHPETPAPTTPEEIA